MWSPPFSLCLLLQQPLPPSLSVSPILLWLLLVVPQLSLALLVCLQLREAAAKDVRLLFLIMAFLLMLFRSCSHLLLLWTVIPTAVSAWYVSLQPPQLISLLPM
ncbi:unnamed protein product, partial [Meganyctiphanes norvegica]